MSSHDISRTVFDPRKRYSSVRMQQGRVIVDDDWNENERIENEERRRTRADVIGAQGTSDKGFLISEAAVNGGKIDFKINPGSFYLGGLRFDATSEETYQTQTDWLQQPVEDGAEVPAAERIDLVYLEGWEQSVTSVEDSELLEVALGGADTSGRMRLMRRVMIEPGIGTADCDDAWQRARKKWHAQGAGVDHASLEVQSRATLAVALAESGTPEDLCTPSVVGGYLGAENQALRVQLRKGGKFTWGFDNASCLYRVTIDEDRKTVRLLTEPKDQAHWPGDRHVVEILPWTAVLPNGEKLAALEGHLSKVDRPYDGVSASLSLRDPIPADFGQAWTSRPDSASLAVPSRSDAENPVYHYMRVWERGSEQAAEDTELDFSSGVPSELPGTGVSVILAGSVFLPGDYWIVALRPETRTTVVPWSLETGRSPHGPRRFRAPLAIIHWRPSPGGVVGEVHDCRRRFRPLNRINSCCNYTVGDGEHSQGDFTSIQAAIDALPPSGGEVCVLQGEFREFVRIKNRSGVRVHGCGSRTVLRQPSSAADAVLMIINSRNISVESMSIVAEDAICTAVIEEFDAWSRLVPVRNISLTELALRSRDASAIAIDGGQEIRIAMNSISIQPLSAQLDAGLISIAGKAPAVYVRADGVLVEMNRILASGSGGLQRTALGGLQIAGGSRNVEIRRNRIQGGNGHGITLGSVAYITEDVAKTPGKYYPYLESRLGFPVKLTHLIAWPNIFERTQDDCVERPEDPQPPNAPDDKPLVPVAGAPLRSIRIIDNVIEAMGGDGIGVPMFFDPDLHEEIVTISDLSIDANRIVGCYRWRRPQPKLSMLYEVGHGGIALADVEHCTICKNEIFDNGSHHAGPTCAVFVLHAEGIYVDDNHIAANGQSVAAPGNQGGIVISNASADVLQPGTRLDPAFATGGVLGAGPAAPVTAAARVHNNVVLAPVGRSLRLIGKGTFAIQGNSFVSQRPGVMWTDLDKLNAAMKQAIAGKLDFSEFDFLAVAVLVINWHGVTRQ